MKKENEKHIYTFFPVGKVTNLYVDNNENHYHQSIKGGFKEISLDEYNIYLMASSLLNDNDKLINFKNSLNEAKNVKSRLIFFNEDKFIEEKDILELIDKCLFKNIIAKIDDSLFITSNFKYRPELSMNNYNYNLVEDEFIYVLSNKSKEETIELNLIERYILEMVTSNAILNEQVNYLKLENDLLVILKKTYEKNESEIVIRDFIRINLLTLINKRIIEVI